MNRSGVESCSPAGNSPGSCGDDRGKVPMKSRTRRRLVQGKFFRWLLMAVGWLAVASGVAGIFLPLLPTVPLLLLAAACFARSSERFHTWLVEHDRLGPLIRDYLGGEGIPLRAKMVAIGMIWVSVPVSAFLFVPVT